MFQNNARPSFLRRLVLRPLLVLLFLIGVVAMMGFATVSSAASSQTSTTNPAKRSTIPTASYETSFMEHMMNHHFAAVKMAQVCEQKAVHQKLLQLCQMIDTSQTQEIKQFQSWLTQWYNIHYTPQLVVPYQKLGAFLSSIQDDTFEVSQFDLWFMQTMNAHHQIAILRSEDCLHHASHKQLKKACQHIITSQGQEIKQQQTWLCQWYDICIDKS